MHPRPTSTPYRRNCYNLAIMTATAEPVRRRFGVLRDFGRLPRVVQLLVLTQLTFNIGFYMVLPYLATHLTEDLALAGAVVGLVLGLRTFSQQGLFVVGGTLTDRI